MFKILLKYLIIFSLFACFYPSEMASAATTGTTPKGGTVSGVDVGELTYKEAKEKVQQEVENWLNGEALLAEGADEAISIRRDSFLFDIDRTFTDMKQQAKRPWYLFFLKPKPVQLPLHVELKDTLDIKWPDYTDSDATLERAREAAAKLSEQPVSIVYKDEAELETGTVAEAAFQIPDIAYVEIEQMAQQINGQSIQSESQFSLMHSVLEEVRPTVSKEGASFFATALYAAVLKTDMDIIERHSQGSVPPYSKAGIEAAVDMNAKKDFIIYNTAFHSYTISSQVKDNKLHISLSSILKNKSYDYQVENKNEIKPRTLYRFSYKLAPGSRVPMESGQKGMQVEVYRLSSVNGAVQEKILISRDFYPPIPTVFLVSSQEPEEVIEELTEKGMEEQENGESTSPDQTEEILKVINKAACQQFEDEMKRKACEQTLIDSELNQKIKSDQETDPTEQATDENAEG